MYYNGTGTSQNFNEAFKWLKKAAEKGMPEAQYNLGKMYAEGKGTLKSDTLAYGWAYIASLNKLEPALEYIKFVDNAVDDGKLPKDYITDGKQMARNLIDEHKLNVEIPEPSLFDKLKNLY